jgi:hypothetical protein
MRADYGGTHVTHHILTNNSPLNMGVCAQKNSEPNSLMVLKGRRGLRPGLALRWFADLHEVEMRVINLKLVLISINSMRS